LLDRMCSLQRVCSLLRHSKMLGASGLPAPQSRPLVQAPRGLVVRAQASAACSAQAGCQARGRPGMEQPSPSAALQPRPWSRTRGSVSLRTHAGCGAARGRAARTSTPVCESRTSTQASMARRQGMVTLLPHLRAGIRLPALHQAGCCALGGTCTRTALRRWQWLQAAGQVTCIDGSSQQPPMDVPSKCLVPPILTQLSRCALWRAWQQGPPRRSGCLEAGAPCWQPRPRGPCAQPT